MNYLFTVGEVAIIQNAKESCKHLNGTECRIESHINIEFCGLKHLYFVSCVDGKERAAANIHLRKKKPPFKGEQIIRDMFIPVKQPDLEVA